MNLTSIARTKEYLGLTQNTSDGVVLSLIARASVQVQKWCSRPFQRTTYSGVFLDGTGSKFMRLPDDPIISLSSLNVGSLLLSPSADGIAAGYQYDDKYVYLFGGYLFPMGRRNVVASFVAGYASSETDFVPVANTPTIAPSTDGYAVVDRGCANASTGAALALVGSGPVAQQYSFANGTYTFNSSISNQAVTMSYDYSPGPVEQAVIELVGGDLKQRDNLGIASKSLRDESISYMDKAMSASVTGLLAQYRRNIPL